MVYILFKLSLKGIPFLSFNNSVLQTMYKNHYIYMGKQMILFENNSKNNRLYIEKRNLCVDETRVQDKESKESQMIIV